MMGIHFRPGGAFPFLPCPLSKLNDDVVDLEIVWDPHEQTLWMVSKGVLNEDSAARAALAELQMLRDGLSIHDLSDRIGLSQRQLLLRFQEHVGLRPKVLARIFRFQKVLRRLERERVCRGTPAYSPQTGRR